MTPGRERSAVRKVGVALSAVGVAVAACCGCGYLSVFYGTQGFWDGPDLLYELGYWNLAVGAGALVLGSVLAGTGVIMLVGKRRGDGRI